MHQPKKSFFERLTGTVKIEEELTSESNIGQDEPRGRMLEETDAEGELTVDVYQTSDDIIVKTMIAGVKPDDIEVNITRDMVTIKGKRSEDDDSAQDYFHRELYWGSFSRTIMLPEEIEVEDAEAIEKHGLLTIRLPKIDKSKQSKLRVKSS